MIFPNAREYSPLNRPSNVNKLPHAENIEGLLMLQILKILGVSDSNKLTRNKCNHKNILEWKKSVP